MLSINLLVIGLSHHFLGEYHILAERVISANKLIPTVRDDVSLDAYYLVAGRRTLETTQLFHHMEEIRQGLYLLKQENNSENGRIQLQIATRTFGTLQRYCQKLGQEIDADVSLELQNVTLEQIRDVSALVYNQIEEYIYLELLWGESIDQMLQTGFQLLLLGDLAAVVLMVAVLAFLLMRINRTINDPIQALVENTRRLAEGDFDALMEDAGENEVTILNKSFNRMAAKLQRLMEKVEEDTRTQEQLELRLLQEQINPHFLYNTLEIIVWLAESGDKEQVIQVVQSLSRFFRVVLSKGRAVVSLQEELSCIQSYLYIQKVRYADILNYEIDPSPISRTSTGRCTSHLWHRWGFRPFSIACTISAMCRYSGLSAGSGRRLSTSGTARWPGGGRWTAASSRTSGLWTDSISRSPCTVFRI